MIALTAVTNDADEEAADIPFYALVDTGADTSLCTRELAEKLFGWKPKDEISIQFLEKAAESYPCIKQTLRLRYDKTKIVELNQISFIDTVLPYKECIPSDQVLRKFDLPEECFPVIQNERRIDMILGAQDMRQFKLLETCKWQEGLSQGPLVGKHPLGSIYWGVKINDGSNPYICAVQRVYKPQYVDQILEVVSAEHNISANE